MIRLLEATLALCKRALSARIKQTLCPQLRWVQNWVQVKKKEWPRFAGKRHQIGHLYF